MAIDIKVTDGVASTISTKLQEIGKGAEYANKHVNDLVKSMSSINSSKMKEISKSALDNSKMNVNSAREDYYRAREKVEMAKLRTAQAQTASVDAKRYHQFAVNAQQQATQKITDAEKIAQSRLATAQKAAATATAQATAQAKQATAYTQAQYQNQLLPYTSNWAHQDNQRRNAQTQNAQAQLGVTQARQDEILNRTVLAQQRLTTEVARGAKEANNASVSAQRLATETQRTASASLSAATAQQRLDASTARTASTVARAAANASAYRNSSSGLGSSSASAAGGVRQLSTAMAQLDTSASFLRSDGLRWAKVMWALGGATLTAHAIVQAADAYTLLQNRLTVVAGSQANVNKLTNEMFVIAERTRQPVAEVTKAFARFDLAMKEMGRGQKETLKLTESVGKALQMSGATAGESASAMLQLSQAFNKGKLDGDEFRSVMENAPIIANALAKQLKVTRGELLKLAPAGKLTVKELTDAIVNATPEINEAFEKFKYTIGQSFIHLRNEMTKFFGELDNATGFTQGIGGAIRLLADNLDTLLFVVMAVAPALGLLVGAKVLGAFTILGGYVVRTSIAIGAMQSPITKVAISLANLGRQGVATGISLTTMFTSPTTRAIAFQLATVRATAGVLALGNAAARAGTMMVAAFSFGNIFLLIGTLVAAAIAFGDQIEMAGAKSYTMRDYVLSALGEVWDFTKSVGNSMYEIIAEMFGASADESETFGQRSQKVFEALVMGGASMVDALFTVFNALALGVKLAVAAIADGIRVVFTVVVNTIIGAVNLAIDLINTLTSAANSVISWTGLEDSVGTFGTIGKVSALEFKSSFNDTLANSSIGTDVAKDAASNYLGRVKDRAEKRHAKNAEEGALREYDASQAAKAAKASAGKANKPKKEPTPKKSDEERRQDILDKAMDKEKKAIAVAKTYGDERERIAAVEELNNKMREKGFAILDAQEQDTIRSLVDQRIATEAVGSAMESLYKEVVEPQLTYNAGMEATANLLRDGVIEADRFVAMQERLKDAYDAVTDSAYAQNKALKEQQYVQGKFGADEAVYKAVYSAVEEARGRGATVSASKAQEIEAITRKLYEMQKAQEASQSVWEETFGAQESIGYSIDAISQAYNDGALSLDAYTRKLAALKAEQIGLSETMSGGATFIDSMRKGMYQLTAEMPMMGQAMADAIQSTLGNAVDNLSSTLTDMVMNFDAYAESVAEALNKPVSTLDVLRYAIGDIIKQIGTELVNAVIKMGVQLAIQAAMNKSVEVASSAATIATQTATAMAVNTAWTPAAISASIATLGGASATGLAGFTAAQTAGKMSSLLSFQDGGLIGGTGTSRSDSTLIRASRGEMIMTGEAVRNNYPVLDAMNHGSTVGSGAGYVDNSVTVNVEVHSDGTSNTNSNTNSEMAQRIASFVKLEVQKEFVKAQRQGQMNY